MQLRSTLQMQQRTSQDAIEVARHFNVNPNVLAGFQRREDMMRHAAVVKYLGDYRQSTEKRLAALEKKSVPDQHFAGGGTQGELPTGSNLYQQWMAHEQQYPDRPNPFDAAYRKSINYP